GASFVLRVPLRERDGAARLLDSSPKPVTPR
ncbi:MAG: hypothetical protein QOI41_797, partial [Myxococcales bacterium]|nr:hypothetical protein [Myxococcales bacterium]